MEPDKGLAIKHRLFNLLKINPHPFTLLSQHAQAHTHAHKDTLRGVCTYLQGSCDERNCLAPPEMFSLVQTCEWAPLSEKSRRGRTAEFKRLQCASGKTKRSNSAQAVSPERQCRGPNIPLTVVKFKYGTSMLHYCFASLQPMAFM